MDEAMKRRCALWDAVNEYVATCGGDPSRHVYGNTSRQRAVAAVERAAALDEITALRARVAELEARCDGWRCAAESQNRQWAAKCEESTETRARAEQAEAERDQALAKRAELEQVVARVRELIDRWQMELRGEIAGLPHTMRDSARQLAAILPAEGT